MSFAMFAGMMGGGGGGQGGAGGMGKMGNMMQMVTKPFMEIIGAMSKSKFAKNIKGIDGILQKVTKGDFMGAITGFLEITGVIDMLTMAVEPLLVLLEPLRALFQIMGASIAKELYPIMTALIPKIMALAPQFEKIGSIIGQFMATFLTEEFVPIVESFIDNLPDLLDLMMELGVSLFDIMDILLSMPKNTLTAILQASIDFMQFVADNGDTIVEVLQAITKTLSILINGYNTLQSISSLSFGSFQQFDAMAADISLATWRIGHLMEPINGIYVATDDARGFLNKIKNLLS